MSKLKDRYTIRVYPSLSRTGLYIVQSLSSGVLWALCGNCHSIIFATSLVTRSEWDCSGCKTHIILAVSPTPNASWCKGADPRIIRSWVSIWIGAPESEIEVSINGK